MSHLQTITKVIELKPFWQNNNFEGYTDYALEVAKTDKAISALFLSKELEVVSIRTTISINVKEKEKSNIKVSKSNESLDIDFWVGLAQGKYS